MSCLSTVITYCWGNEVVGAMLFCYLIPNLTEKKYLTSKVQNMYPQLQRRTLGKICIENNNLIVVSRELHFLIRQQDIVLPLPPKKNKIVGP